MTRAEMETRIRETVTGAFDECSMGRLSINAACNRTVRKLIELLTEPADNFTCAVPLREQIGVLTEAMTMSDLFRNSAFEAAIASLRWLECHVQGRESSNCTDESGAKL